MKDTAAHIEILCKKVKDYTNTNVSLYKLKAIDTTADIVSSIVSKALLILIVSTFLLFLNIGLSLYIGKLLESNYLGFLITSSFYLLLGISFYIFRKSLVENSISNLVIRKLHPENNINTNLISNEKACE